MHRYVIGITLVLILFTACKQKLDPIEDIDPTDSSAFAMPIVPDTVYPLNITFKNETYYYAASQVPYNGLMGWAKDDNFLRKIYYINFPPSNAVTLKVETQVPAVWMYAYSGYKMYLYNTTMDTLFLPAQDSKLYFVVEAMDSLGDWYSIEYMQPSWCGNSYHSLTMPPDYYWSLTVPQYEGSFKTKLRAKGYYYKQNKRRKKDDAEFIYSNEWEGSINPEQFCRLPELFEEKKILDWYMERWNERFGKK